MKSGLELYGLCCLSALGAMFLSASWGGVLVAWISELSAWMKKIIFRDKYAQQVTRLSLWAMVLGWAFLSGALVWAERIVPQWREGMGQVSLKTILYPGILFLCGFILLLGYLSLWKILRKKKPFHLILGFLSLLSIWVGVYSLFNAKMRLLFDTTVQDVSKSQVWKFFLLPVPVLNSWLFFGHILFLALGSSGLLGLLYLLVRRKRDDFGRDYYRYAISFAGKWSVSYAFQLIVLIGVLVVFTNMSQTVLREPLVLIPFVVSCLCYLIPVWLLIRIIQNDTPLRLKGTMIVSVILSWLALSACSVVYLNIFQRDLMPKVFLGF
jgi:hypothetical protein